MFLVGIFLPPIIELINKDVKQDDERFGIAIVVCIVASVVMHPEYFSQIQFSNLHVFLPSLFQTFTLEYALSTLVFKLYWRDSFARTKLQALIGSAALAG